MSTSFSNKINILADVHSEALWNEQLKDFASVNDVALPLAYLVDNNLAEIKDEAKHYIEETWEMLCQIFQVDPNETYENSDDLLEKSPVSGFGTEESE